MRSTVAALTIVSALAFTPFAQAQNAGTTTGNGTTTSSGTAGSGSGTPAGQASAGGQDNQAVATTNANAPQPAHGANSFSKRQARHRMMAEGFHKISSLHKDSNGIWRGNATKGGAPTQVWLDYKGNVGQGAE